MLTMTCSFGIVQNGYSQSTFTSKLSAYTGAVSNTLPEEPFTYSAGSDINIAFTIDYNSTDKPENFAFDLFFPKEWGKDTFSWVPKRKEFHLEPETFEKFPHNDTSRRAGGAYIKNFNPDDGNTKIFLFTVDVPSGFNGDALITLVAKPTYGGFARNQKPKQITVKLTASPSIAVSLDSPAASQLNIAKAALANQFSNGAATSQFITTFTGLGVPVKADVNDVSFRVVKAQGDGTGTAYTPETITEDLTPSFRGGTNGIVPINLKVTSYDKTLTQGKFEHTFNVNINTSVTNKVTIEFNWKIPADFIPADQPQGNVYLLQIFGNDSGTAGLQQAAQWAFNVLPNKPPQIEAFTISGGSNTNDNVIAPALVTAFDPDDRQEAITFDWKWANAFGDIPRAAGTDVAGTADGTGSDRVYTISTIADLASSKFKKGETIKLLVRATNASGESDFVEAVLSNKIGNIAPTLDQTTPLTIAPASPKFNSTLTATGLTIVDQDFDEGIDVGAKAPVFQYQWHQKIGTGAFGPIAGATNKTLTFSELAGSKTKFDRGDQFQVVVTAKDDTDTSAPVTSAPVEIANTAPVANEIDVVFTKPQTPPEVPDPQIFEITLSAKDDDNDSIKEYKIKTLPTDTVGTLWEDSAATTTAIDSVDTTITASSDTAVIYFKVATVASEITAKEVFTYSAIDEVDGEGDSQNISVRYLENQAPHRPKAVVVSSNPDPAFAGAVLTATVTPDDTDILPVGSPDGTADFDKDAIGGKKQYKFTWKRTLNFGGKTDTTTEGNVVIKEHTVLSSTTTEAGINSADVKKGVWTCEVTAFDGIADSEPRSGQKTVLNSVPTISGSVSLTPDPAFRASKINVDLTQAIPADADSEDDLQPNTAGDLAIVWFVNDVETSDGDADDTEFDGQFEKGDVVKVRVRAKDGENAESIASQDLTKSITISNTLPTASKPSSAVTAEEDTEKKISVTLGDTKTPSSTDIFVNDDDPTDNLLTALSIVSSATGDPFPITTAKGGTITLTITLERTDLKYKPVKNFNGTGENADSFDFWVRDGSGGISTTKQTVTIDVDPVNDKPSVSDVSGSVGRQNEANTLSIPVKLKGTDPDDIGGAIASFEIKELPAANLGVLKTAATGGADIVIGTNSTITAVDNEAEVWFFPTLSDPPPNGRAEFTFFATDNGMDNGAAVKAAKSNDGTARIAVGTPPWFPFIDIKDFDSVPESIDENTYFAGKVYKVLIELESEDENFQTVLNTTIKTSAAKKSVSPIDYLQANVNGLKPSCVDATPADGACDDPKSIAFGSKYVVSVSKFNGESMMFEAVGKQRKELDVDSYADASATIPATFTTAVTTPDIPIGSDNPFGANDNQNFIFNLGNSSGYTIAVKSLATNNILQYDQILQPDAEGVIAIDGEFTELDVFVEGGGDFEWSITPRNPKGDGTAVTGKFNIATAVTVTAAPSGVDENSMKPGIAQPDTTNPGFLVGTASANNEAVVRLEWDKVDKAADYSVFVATAGGMAINLTNNGATNGNRFFNVSLKPGQYRWHVITKNSIGFNDIWSPPRYFQIEPELATAVPILADISLKTKPEVGDTQIIIKTEWIVVEAEKVLVSLINSTTEKSYTAEFADNQSNEITITSTLAGFNIAEKDVTYLVKVTPIHVKRDAGNSITGEEKLDADARIKSYIPKPKPDQTGHELNELSIAPVDVDTTDGQSFDSIDVSGFGTNSLIPTNLVFEASIRRFGDTKTDGFVTQTLNSPLAVVPKNIGVVNADTLRLELTDIFQQPLLANKTITIVKIRVRGTTATVNGPWSRQFFFVVK